MYSHTDGSFTNKRRRFLNNIQGPMDNISVPGTGIYSELNNEGVFHQWGLAIEETTESVCSYTVAIVEAPDGTIKEIIPSKIKFIS